MLFEGSARIRHRVQPTRRLRKGNQIRLKRQAGEKLSRICQRRLQLLLIWQGSFWSRWQLSGGHTPMWLETAWPEKTSSVSLIEISVLLPMISSRIIQRKHTFFVGSILDMNHVSFADSRRGKKDIAIINNTYTWDTWTWEEHHQRTRLLLLVYSGWGKNDTGSMILFFAK